MCQSGAADGKSERLGGGPDFAQIGHADQQARAGASRFVLRNSQIHAQFSIPPLSIRKFLWH